MASNARKLFINLPVNDIQRSKAFFQALGFSFNPKFESADACCMVMGEDNYAMLLKREYFKTFTPKQLCDTSTHSEAIIAFNCQSKAEVEELGKKALAAGAKQAMPPKDQGFMYTQAFFDLDGHHWEAFWMDPAAAA